MAERQVLLDLQVSVLLQKLLIVFLGVAWDILAVLDFRQPHGEEPVESPSRPGSHQKRIIVADGEARVFLHPLLHVLGDTIAALVIAWHFIFFVHVECSRLGLVGDAGHLGPNDAMYPVTTDDHGAGIHLAIFGCDLDVVLAMFDAGNSLSKKNLILVMQLFIQRFQ